MSAWPWTTLQQPVGQAGAGEDAPDPLADQAGVGRWLEHDAVAGHQRDSDVSQRRGERLGRRPEHADDPERLVAPAPALDRVLRAREGIRSPARIAGPCSASHCSVSMAARSSMTSASARGRPCSRDDEVGQLVGLVDDRLRGAGHVARAVGEAQQRPQRLHARRRVTAAATSRGARPPPRPGPTGGRAEGLQLGSGCGRLHGEARLPPRARAGSPPGARAARPRPRRAVEALARHALGASS